jgi:phosphoglycerol transferase MdoB-like AlkP superfamily enzyme
MNQPIGLLLRHCLFFLLVFLTGRLVFLGLNYNAISASSWFEILKTFPVALYLDVSTICYFLVLLFIPYVIFLFSNNFKVFRLIRALSSLIIIIHFIILVSEIMIYKEWKTKLSFRALSFLANPSEVIHVVSILQIVTALSAITVLSFLAIWIQNKYVLKYNPARNKPHWALTMVYTVLIIIGIPIGIRGGLQPIPIIQSDVYFSTNNTLNLAAVNVIWNLGQSVWENRYTGNTNPYTFYTDDARDTIFKKLTQPEQDSTTMVLNQKQPNIVLIMLESWSAELVGAFDGHDSVAKNVSALARTGIRFTNCYSPGALSDEGHVAILSAFPSQPKTILTSQPQKYPGLHTLTKSLSDVGYSSAYVYAGDLSYGNIKSYVFYNGYNKVYDKDNIAEANWESGRLGYHDAYLFEKLKTEANHLPPPFFLTAFTLSTHSPFDFEGTKKVKDKGEYSDYMSSVFYADSVIGAFMTYCKTQAWYSNTLFVFLSDHSHPSPLYNQFMMPGDRRIVAFMYGDVIKQEWKGTKVNTTSNQQDFAPTICKQLGLTNPFKYGKNLFNPYGNKYGYYSFDVGFGFVTDSGSYVYDLRSKSVRGSTFKTEAGKLRADSLGKAYLQSLYSDYLSF